MQWFTRDRAPAQRLPPGRLGTEGRDGIFSLAQAGGRDFALAVGGVVFNALWVGVLASAPGVRPSVRSGMSNM